MAGTVARGVIVVAGSGSSDVKLKSKPRNWAFRLSSVGSGATKPEAALFEAARLCRPANAVASAFSPVAVSVLIPWVGKSTK